MHVYIYSQDYVEDEVKNLQVIEYYGTFVV